MAQKRGWKDWVKGIALYGMAPNGDLILIRTDEQGNLTVNLIPHHTTHEAGGSDEIDVTGLKGVLAELQYGKWYVYDTRANFPSTAEVGALAYATDEKRLYRWDGASWVMVLSLSYVDLQNTAHASQHEAGGVDEINVAGLHGELADPQTPKAHASTHESGGTDEINVTGLHGELADPQTPKAHASTHEYGGSDPISQLDTAEKLSDLLPRSGIREMTGPLLGKVDDHHVREFGRMGCSLSGYDSRGAGYILPGCWDRLLFLDKKGGSITATKSPAGGSLSSIVDGTGNRAYWHASDLPVTVTLNLEEDYLYCRDFFIHWCSGHAPKEFKVRFKKSDGTLLKEVHETNWDPSWGVFCLAGENYDLYYTRKIEIEIIQAQEGSDSAHIYEVIWLCLVGTTVVEPALYRGGGDMYGDIDMNGNDILSPGLVDGVNVSAHASRHHSTGADPVDFLQLKNRIHASKHHEGGDDEVDFLQLKNRKHAARHKAGGDDELRVGELAGVYAGMQSVFSGTAPTSWTDLDLSSYVGSRYALVLLRVKELGGVVNNVVFRANDDPSATDLYADQYPAANKTRLNAYDAGYVVLRTDHYGKVEWIAEKAESVNIYLMAAIALE